jgi:hypothetical protein
VERAAAARQNANPTLPATAAPSAAAAGPSSSPAPAAAPASRESYRMTQGLKTLILMGAYKLSDAGLEDLLTVCPVVEALSLEQCSRITDTSLPRLPLLCGASLKDLNLTLLPGLSAAALSACLRQLPHLERLSLQGCVDVSDDVLRTVAQSCPRLREIDLSKCGKVTDVGVRALAEGCTALEAIDLSDIGKISDE